jgi:hypothetical protein
MIKRNMQPTPQILKVHDRDIVCDDFLGLSAVYHGFARFPEIIAAGFTDSDRELEYGFVQSSNIKIARTMFLPAYNCADIYGPYDMQNPRMQAFTDWCADMKRIGVDIAIQSAWHYSRDTYFGHDKPDPEKDPPAFADWVCQSLDYLIRERQLDNIKYMFLFTEPTGYSSGITPDGYDIWTYYVKICNILNDKLKAYGLRDKIKLVGPNNSGGGTHLAEALRDLDGVIDIYTGHDYNHVSFGSWVHMARRMKSVVGPKPFWMDEYGMQLEIFRQTPEYGTYLASIIAASIQAGHQTSLIWILTDQLYAGWRYDYENIDFTDANNTDSFHQGVHRWGLTRWRRDTDVSANTVIPYPAWYAFKLISNAFAGRENHGKAQSFACDNSLWCLTAAVADATGYTVLAVNYSAEQQPVEIVFDNIVSKIFRQRTYDVRNYDAEPEVTLVQAVDGTLRVTLPAGGFAVFTERETL